jgi:heptose I phosphotransferase
VTTLYLDKPFRSLWISQDPFIAVEQLHGDVLRALEGRRTLRIEIANHGYFAKIHRGIGWREIFKNLLSLRLPVTGARNEWQALQRLHEHHIDTMRAVAYGERGCNPARRHSFLITEELAPTISLEDFCREWKSNPPAPALKWRLIRRVAEMTGAMHRAGINHRDLYICHFLLHLPAGDNPRLSLIDLHRAQIRDQTPHRWRDKDLAALLFSTHDIGLTPRDHLRFLRAYFAQPLRNILRQEHHLVGWLPIEARRLRARYLRRYAPKTND